MDKENKSTIEYAKKSSLGGKRTTVHLPNRDKIRHNKTTETMPKNALNGANDTRSKMHNIKTHLCLITVVSSKLAKVIVN